MSANFGLPIDRVTGLEMLAQADADRTKLWEAVLLLGDAATVAAAREWKMAVGQLELFARDPTDDDQSPEWLTNMNS
jgi:hypothetical protein